MSMNRRDVLKAGAYLVAASTILGASGVRAQSRTLLKFIPQANLAILDPVISTAGPTRTHGLLVFDTLFTLDKNKQPSPQMVSEVELSDDKLVWTMTLRDGLTFHDGSPVTAEDVVASISRWGRRDVSGQTLFARVDAFEALSEKQFQFRLNKPYALLPANLGKDPGLVPVIMPKRLAESDPADGVKEMIGSGPYKFIAEEYKPGAFVAYERFEGYVPRSADDGAVSKETHFDRIEWHIVPDPATALAAMQTGEMDWWETPLSDFVPIIESTPSLQIIPASKQTMMMRLNHLNAPFDNPEIRRLLLSCIDREAVMQAAAGGGSYGIDFGVWSGALATTAGIAETFRARKDFDVVREELAAAGYAGEPVVFLVGSDTPLNAAASLVMLDIMQNMGFNVDYQVMDWGTATQRRVSMEPTDKGGWSCFIHSGDEEFYLDPTTNFFLRGKGKESFFGWPTSAKLEELIAAWLDAPDLDAQKKIAEEIQLQNWKDVAMITFGTCDMPAVAQANLKGFTPGFPRFWGVERV